MPDKYNITTLIPTHSANEVSARLIFADPAMNAELQGGAAIFQTIDDHWQLSTSVRQEAGASCFIFKLHFKTGPDRGYKVPGNKSGSVEWKTCFRLRQDLTTDTNYGHRATEAFTFGETFKSEIVCTFESARWNTLVFASAPSGNVLHLEITINFPAELLQYQRWKEMQFNSWSQTSFKFACLLLDPTGGDVVFVVRGPNGLSKRLYAYKSILTRNSDYFAASLKPEWTQKRLRTPRDVEKDTNRPTVASTSQTEIYLDQPEDDIDFVTLHNILYFIYIGCVNLPFSHTESLPEGYPDEADPFLLFRAADKFLLPSLKEQCFFHLEHGVTVENVAEMLFHPDCELHTKLQQHYMDYIIANFKEVKDTEGWERAICDEDVSPAIYRYRSRLFLEITKKLGNRLSKVSLNGSLVLIAVIMASRSCRVEVLAG